MSLKELRRRISSVKSTQKITSAMKMVASAKLRRLQERLNFGAEYLQRLKLIGNHLGEIHQDLEILSPWLSNEGKQNLIIIFGAERGLCGSFHTNFLRYANQVIDEQQSAQLVVFGQKAKESLKGRYKQNHLLDICTTPSMPAFLDLAKAVEPLKKSKEIGKIYILGSAFKNILKQEMYFKPFSLVEHKLPQRAFDTTIFEPSPDVFLPHFCSQYLSASFHQAWLESLTGEMASRMTAMDNATRNATDMIHDLSLEYNRTRQAHITTELNEIIAGSEGAK